MVYIGFNQKKLSKVLGIANQISNPKNPVEIFTYTKFEITGEKVIISSINQDIFYQTSVKPTSLEEVKAEISFLIKTDAIANCISLINDEIVGLEIDQEKSTLVVQGSKSKHTLRINLEDLGDFVAPKRKEDQTEFTIKADLDKILKGNKIGSIAVGNPRTVYQAEFLSLCYTLNAPSSKLTLAATDRYRVTKYLIDVDYTFVKEELKDTKKNFLIPPKSLSILPSLEAKETFELSFEDSFLWIKADDAVLVIRYGEGTFPDYEKIIPQSFTCSFSANTKDFLDALKQAQFSARINSKSQSVNLQFVPTDKKVVVSAKTDDGYASESTVDLITYEGLEEKWDQSFNIDYLLSYLNNVETENIVWEANPGKPAVLSPEGQKQTNLYLVSGLK